MENIKKEGESNNESTFVLVTSKLSQEELSEIKNRILESGLEITSQEFIQLDKTKIQKIWPSIINEPTQETTYQILSGRELLLIHITGDLAASRIVSLKKEVRKNYISYDDKFNRMIHCPDSHEDCLREKEIILGLE